MKIPHNIPKNDSSQRSFARTYGGTAANPAYFTRLAIASICGYAYFVNT